MTSTTTALARDASARPGVAVGVAASAWLRPLVDGPVRSLRVVGSSGRAAYAHAAGADVVALETGAGARLPNALAVGIDDVHGLRIGMQGRIGGGLVELGSHAFAVRRWWDPRPRLGPVEFDVLRRNRSSLPAEAVCVEPGYGLTGPVEQLRAAAIELDLDILPAIVVDLVGRGPGSTPSGDDVLAGLLAALRVCGGTAVTTQFADTVAHLTRARAHRTTALSATLLRCADDGAVAGAARRALLALAGHGALAPAVRALTALGHTSGRDLLTGITIAVDVLGHRKVGT